MSVLKVGINCDWSCNWNWVMVFMLSWSTRPANCCSWSVLAYTEILHCLFGDESRYKQMKSNGPKDKLAVTFFENNCCVILCAFLWHYLAVLHLLLKSALLSESARINCCLFSLLLNSKDPSNCSVYLPARWGGVAHVSMSSPRISRRNHSSSQLQCNGFPPKFKLMTAL